jgi:hypothetical protein
MNVPRAGLAVAFALVSIASGCRPKTEARHEDAAAPSAAPAPSASAAPKGDTQPQGAPSTTKPEVRGKVEGSGEGVPAEDPKKSFVENRVARGAAGEIEIAGLRVWHCGPSCTCPPPCIQTVAPEGAASWVDLHDDSGEPVSLADWATADVTGRFTGRTRKGRAGGGDGPEVTVSELRLTSPPTVVGTSMGAPELEGAREKILLAGALAKKVVPRIHDDKPFLVVAGAFPMDDPARADEGAGALFEKLTKAGISDAERADSRAFAGLACCFEVVLGGRFSDAKAAEARAKLLAAKGIKGAYTKKGF